MADDLTRPAERTLPRIGGYALLEPLGSGGMSSVFLARHVESGVEVAVKILPRNLAKNPAVLQRFLREAKSAEALQHPNIVSIYDRGVDQGRNYLVLEYVRGGDLHDKVRADGPLPIDVAVSVVRQVAEGLNYAAGQGLIHRDIKPANLLLTPEGTVKVIDLGLALHAATEDERVTREGTTVGTVDYMAPEQARDSRATSIRSDIYSLGCTFVFLLTGQAPFPGGDVAEKLHRHIHIPATDPRERRPEIPDGLARVILTMLAKSPEARFTGYPELIAALDNLPNSPGLPLISSTSPEPQPLFALMDDDEGGSGSGAVGDGFGVALLDAVGASDLNEVSMAELADLDKADARPRFKTPRLFPGQGRGLQTFGGPDPEESLPPVLATDGDEDDDLFSTNPAPVNNSRNPSAEMSVSERSWVTKVVASAVALVALVIVGDQIINRSSSDPPIGEAESTSDTGSGTEPIPGASAVGRAAVAVPRPLSLPTKGDVAQKAKLVARPEEPEWVEPVDRPVQRVSETSFGPGLESQFVPDWASALSAKVPQPPGRTVTVRRLADPSDPEIKPSFRAAFDVPGSGTVVVADNGPFFEDDLRVTGESRVVRAAPGFRPLISLEPSRIDARRAQAVYLDLGEKAVAFEGLDIVVDVAQLPPTQATLFQVRGGTLAFRDCSLTIVNRGGRPFSLVKTIASARPSRVLFDRTLVRGCFSAAAETSGAASDVVLLRSVVVNGQGSAILVSGPAAAWLPRQISVVRSLVVSRGPAFDLADTPPGAKPRPHLIRVLGTTFAHFASDTPSGFIVARADAGNPQELLDWHGDANSYAGWSEWLGVGPSPSMRVAELDAARAVWPGQERSSDTTLTAWPLPLAPELLIPSQLTVHAPNRLAILGQVPTPNFSILEQTVGAFPRPVVPAVASEIFGESAVGAFPAGSGAGIAPGSVASRVTAEQAMSSGRLNAAGEAADPRPRTHSGGIGSGPVSGRGGGRELFFDVEAPTYQGDLGLYLAETLRPSDTRVKVRVSGRSSRAWSPVRLPEGINLEVVVEPTSAGQVPDWTAARLSPAEALIDARGGSLVLVGVHIARDASANLKRLIRIERGHLVLVRCRFDAPGVVEPGGGALIAFNAPGSAPLRTTVGGTWPFVTSVDRPTCRVIESILSTGGEVLSAEVGRGLVAFGQCVVIAGDSAFSLHPGRVASHRLDADLVLDRCTLSAGHAFVRFGNWRGSAPGPARPWLISSTRCVFFGFYDQAEQAGALLRADPDGLAHGGVFWQSQGDALEVPAFLAATDSPLPTGRRPDVRLQWVAVWGDRHARALGGPRLPGGLPGTRPVGRLKPGAVKPGDLAIDPDYPPGRGTPALGVDLSRLGITPTPRGRRRR